MTFFKKLKNRLFPKPQIILSPKQIFPLVGSYVLSKVKPQFRAVLLVSIFLAAIQYFVLRAPLQHSLSVAVCVGAAILGLSFFLEGLFLGIMPLGEQCGMRLPAKIGAAGVAIFSIVIGIAATLAEPAIAVLQHQGSIIPAWNAPLLYLLLNRGTTWLVAAIAAGVGFSVVLGVFRFMFGWAFKPPVFIIIPIIVTVSCVFDQNPVLRPVVNLAWDAGGAATGAVTVPIILALGLGVVKTGGKSSNSSGLGLVTLASALPVAGVLLLAALLGSRVPMPSGAQAFFSPEPEQRAKAVYVAGGTEELAKMAEEAVQSGDLSSEEYYRNFPDQPLNIKHLQNEESAFSSRSLLDFFHAALFAVLPLALTLIISIILIARDRIHNFDVAVLGIAFAAIGMFALNLGMTGGITALSSQAGSSFRHAYSETARTDETVVLKGVGDYSFITVPGETGPETYIWIAGEKGLSPQKFVPERLSDQTYVHIPVDRALFDHFGTTGAYLAILAIAFLLGFLAIFAEPALAVTAVTVEEMTTGTFKRTKLILIAAVGVGCGMAAGFARVLFSNLLPIGSIHLTWMLAPCYALALILTVFAPEDFSSIAWDVAGIATGPIAVPIIITTGLGLGSDSLRADGAFGIVAMASVFPIIVILVSGIIDTEKSKRAIGGGYAE